MTARMVLDTNIVIDLLKKSTSTVERFLDALDSKTTILISPIVVAEIYAGAFVREYRDIEALFALCQLTELNADIARIAGQYANQFAKSHQGVGLDDLLLAATAKAHDCPLWTRNRKHYPMTDIEVMTD